MLNIGTKVVFLLKEDRAPKNEGEIISIGSANCTVDTKVTIVPYYIVDFGNRPVVCLKEHIEEVLPIPQVPQKSDPSRSTVRMPTPKQIIPKQI